MNFKSLFLALPFLGFVLPPVFSAEKGLPIALTPFYENEWANITAPFSEKNTVKLVVGGILTSLAYELKYKKRRPPSMYRAADKKKWRQIGDLLGWGPLPLGYSALMGLDYFFYKDRSSLKKTEYILKTTLYTALSTFLIKSLVKQGRPKDPLKFDSFPSGHASNAFAFSTAIWMAHGPYWGALAHAVALWVSYSRIHNGSHYYHDTLFGITWGASYAVGIYHNHFHKDLDFLFAVTPIYTDQGAGLAFTTQW